MEAITRAVEWFTSALAQQLGLQFTFYVAAFLAVILVSVVCGMAGSLVVGNRMSFFSDAMAHCAFAGVALASLGLILSGVPRAEQQVYVPPLMVGFGALIGVAIAFVRERTSLASDTVIGVFFA